MHPAKHAETNPAKPALIYPDQGLVMDFATLDALSNRHAHQLRAMGLQRGDVVAFLFGNGPEVFIASWAAQRSGLYATSISNRLSAADVAYILRDSGAKLLLASDSLAELAAAATVDLPDLKAFLWNAQDGRLGNWSALASTQPASPIADESAGNDLLYSSGTTGRPKGVKPVLPEGPIHDETPLTRMGSSLYGMSPDTVYLSTSPMYHAAPLRWALTVQRLGGSVVMMHRFDPEEALKLIEAHRITHSTFVPTHFVRMLKLPDEVRQRYDVGSLEAVIHAAAPCPVDVKRAMIEWFGPVLHEYYAGTETCGITAINTEEWLRKPGSVGRAVLGTTRIIGENGEELPAGETGQIFFSDGPKFEYLNDPEKTAAAHNDKGWATIGDIGHVDEDGFLFLTDRKSFMIISGGVNIYPQEIENVLVTHPKVLDAAVFGVPDDEMGERVLAVIQPVAGVAGDAALADELRQFTRERLGGVKTPKDFDFREELPREPTGKLMKRKLFDEYRQAATNAG
ncbi:acyl-CoA synthetase [Tsuneonella sp. CC-YZS046]|uniref:acyl-CoA synthetase n=1 Tax=Tsuneonella sp. CC-YZS046 TaxID=3042152 RepID=UPI002D771E99|nr:acyl-CoA synthetase [Tsuneonella sp. CC-YZS046]WRO65190.1 acyl-CoA synthetase [Tsuneonella sp. CC-YZS046]